MQININDYLDNKVIELDQGEYELLYMALKFAGKNTMFVMNDEIDDRMQTLVNKLPVVE